MASGFEIDPSFERKLEKGLRNASAAGALVFQRTLTDMIKISVFTEYREQQAKLKALKDSVKDTKATAKAKPKTKKSTKGPAKVQNKTSIKKPKPVKKGGNISSVPKVPKSAKVSKLRGIAKQAKTSIRRKKAKRKVRSKPGEPPRRDTGNLIRSWRSIRKNNNGMSVVFADERAPYAIWLETGTRNVPGRRGGNMKPRPYIIKSINKARPRMLAVAQLAINKALR